MIPKARNTTSTMAILRPVPVASGGGAIPGSGGGGGATKGSAGGNGSAGGGGGGGAAAAAAASVVPQLPQNAAFGATGEPQLGHAFTFVIVTGAKETSEGASAVPHSLQKVDPSRFTVP